MCHEIFILTRHWLGEKYLSFQLTSEFCEYFTWKCRNKLHDRLTWFVFLFPLYGANKNRKISVVRYLKRRLGNNYGNSRRNNISVCSKSREIQNPFLNQNVKWFDQHRSQTKKKVLIDRAIFKPGNPEILKCFTYSREQISA